MGTYESAACWNVMLVLLSSNSFELHNTISLVLLCYNVYCEFQNIIEVLGQIEISFNL